MAKLLLPKVPLESVAVTVRLKGPAVVGVPVIAPLVESARPSGNPVPENV